MTKTQRRRSARATHHQAIVSQDSGVLLDYAAAVKLLRDPFRWKILEDALRGLIAIEITSPFMDTERMCPEAAYLVVHLDILRGPASVPVRRRRPTGPNLQLRVDRVLTAVAALCASAQCTSRWDDLYMEFWKRVVESDVMTSPSQQSVVVKWVRFTRNRFIPLLLSWCNKPFIASQLMEPLRSFLYAPKPAISRGSRTTIEVGLRFECTAISTSVLDGLRELLVMPTGKDDSLLIEPSVLRTLWLSSNPFYVPELSVLCEIFSDPTVRRIDDFQLNGIINAQAPATTEPPFLLALSRVFNAAFTSKWSSNDSRPVGPLSFSLADSFLDTAHVDALQAAIRRAERPLSGLNLSGIQLSDVAGWDILVQLIFTPLSTATPTAVLNVSHLKWYLNQLRGSHRSLVRTTINRLHEAGAFAEEIVECRLSDAVLWMDERRMTRIAGTVSVTERFKIHEFHPATNLLRVTASLANAQEVVGSISGWVDVLYVVELWRNASEVVSTSFPRLICDDTTDAFACLPVVNVTSMLGPRLTSLSLRHFSGSSRRLSQTASCLPEILSRCPRLEELSLEGTQLVVWSSPPFWDQPAFALPASLQILNLDQCGLRDVSLGGLSMFPLRCLSLLGNSVGAEGVESLLSMLRLNTRLRHVELNVQSSEPTERCTALRSQITTLLDLESLQPRGKAVVLSVFSLSVREAARAPYPGNDIVAFIFAFVGTRPSRIVNWSL